MLMLANLLLSVGVYMLFPLFYRRLTGEWGCSVFTSGGLTLLFALAMSFLGAFNNYLVDTFSRRHVCIYSMMALAAAGIASLYVSHQEIALLLWIAQGSLFGVALMGTGSTLVIDVTPSHKRNDANRIYTWIGILGSVIGLQLGADPMSLLPVQQWVYISAALCVVAAMLVYMVNVCFRAPLDLPLCSLDRFILFRALPPGLNMMIVPFTVSALLSHEYNPSFTLSMVGGGLLYLLCRRFFLSMKGRLRLVYGQLLTCVGLLIILLTSDAVALSAGGFLVGLGASFSIGRFLHMMILLPMHCERGTGFQTFQLLWHLAFVAGIAGAIYGASWPVCEVLAVLTLAGLLWYQFYTHRYFDRHYQQH